MLKNLEKIKERHQELQTLLEKGNFSNPQEYQKIVKEYNELNDLVILINEKNSIAHSIEELEASLSKEKDKEMAGLIKEEILTLEKKVLSLENNIRDITEPAHPWDKKNIIVEIRSGVGGDEAELFCSDLFRMYTRFAERKKWKTKVISRSSSPLGGLKEIIFEIKGANVYKHLKYESGVHRVQRIPETEKGGRIHTSTATVAILPEAEEIDIKLKPEDLKIETSTSQGAGGQSVNTTYSAIRITHLPTGLVVSCQDERSQQQNREKALQILSSRLLALEEEKRLSEEKESRRLQIGTAKRAEKIRTYNIPQDRVTDHRLKENWHNINEIFDGELDPIIETFWKEERK